MEPEGTTSSKSKKFFKIALGVLAVVAVLLGTAFILTERKNAKQAAGVQQPEVRTVVTLPKPTDEEVLQSLTAPTFTPATSTNQTNKTIVKTLSAPPQKKTTPLTADKATQSIIDSLSAPR